ncbi:hypothetical protein RUM44_002885 [Polyplax serrata]|uniref:Uncharacterized protein n=1 Tax=Polyplax serrata TaxID=468196 RepID=A0ABR1AWZ2_POLSC
MANVTSFKLLCGAVMEREVESPRQSYFKHHTSDEERDKDALQMKPTSKLTAEKTCSCGKSTSNVDGERERSTGRYPPQLPEPSRNVTRKTQGEGTGSCGTPRNSTLPFVYVGPINLIDGSSLFVGATVGQACRGKKRNTKDDNRGNSNRLQWSHTLVSRARVLGKSN